MSTRPEVAAEVLAQLTQAVPPRVSKRLDTRPRVADEWTWTFGTSVTVAAGEETVTLASEGVSRADQATCTCLLAPRCFHLLAVLTVLPVAEGGATSTESAHRPEHTTPPELEERERQNERPNETSPLTEADRALAVEASRLGGTLLFDGLASLSTIRLGELLRLVHACRGQGLYRLEACALGVYEAARDLRAKSPDLRLDDAASRLAEFLLVAHRLGQGDASPPWRGIARRRYAPRAGLRLTGIACEPVLRRGYAGVVTYLTDGREVYSAQEVIPGDAERARFGYDAQLRFGETSLSHREAARGGLLFARAEVSPEGRLGAGREVACVAIGADAALLEPLFRESLTEQLARADRGERQGLVFLTGTMRSGRRGFALQSTEALVPLGPPIDEATFPYRENLERLAYANTKVALVARVVEGELEPRPIAVSLLSEDGELGPWFSLGYDRLTRAHVEPASPEAALEENETSAERLSELTPLRRRVLRYALAGRSSLPGAALPEVSREASRLRAALFPTGAEGLEALSTAHEPERVANVWLALHVYLAATSRSLSRSTWVSSPG